MTAPPLPGNAGAWDDAAGEFARGLLDRLQGSAKVWVEGIAALTGVFGTVALAAGPESIAQVDEDWQVLVVSLAGVAGVLSLVSCYLLTKAQELPVIDEDSWDGTAYRAWLATRLPTIRQRLVWGRRLGIAAALVVFVVGFVVLLSAVVAPVATTPG